MAISALPRATRLFLVGNTVSMAGNGLVIAFTLIYLHDGRHVALPVVGALLATSSVVGLIVVPIAGILLDRLGARKVLAYLILGQAITEVLLAWAHDAITALPAMVLYGATWVPMFSAIRTMIGGLTPDPVTQQRAFAINFTLQNAALGTGTTIGAAFADVSHPGSFQALFVIDAATCLLFLAVFPFLPDLRLARHHDEAPAGYRQVLAHRGLRLVTVASLILAFTGYPAFDSGLPAFSTVVAHLSAHVVALALSVNTAIIVAFQLIALRLVGRIRRSQALALAGLVFAASWAVFGLAGLPISVGWRIACVFGFTATFGIGETMMMPTVGPLINSLADERVRGRANSLTTFSSSLAFIVSPALATGLIAAGAAGVWIGLLCAGCLSMVAISARLRRALTVEQDRVGASPPDRRARAETKGQNLIKTKSS
jgi:MFS family permease